MSHATIGIADHTAADRLRDRDNATRISDNAAAIGDHAHHWGQFVLADAEVQRV